MVWRVEISSRAKKALNWLQHHEPQLFPRILGVLEDLAKNPYQGKTLGGDLIGKYSYRVGSYRVIYQLFKGEMIVLVLKIGHRREIYR